MNAYNTAQDKKIFAVGKTMVYNFSLKIAKRVKR